MYTIFESALKSRILHLVLGLVALQSSGEKIANKRATDCLMKIVGSEINRFR